MFSEIQTTEEYQNIVKSGTAALIFLSNDTCGVCSALKPKVEDLAVTEFPQIKLLSVNCDQLPELSANLNVFTVPTLLLFIEGRETLRKVRNFSIDELRTELNRIFKLLY